ncbi:MAG TPA: hypothetical protein VID47_02850 [Actinomycetota bacterium]|jgi:hypothetical protein
MPRRVALGAGLAALIVLAGSCTGSNAPARVSAGATSEPPGTSPAPTPSTPPTTAATVALRDCADAVHGSLGSGWRTSSVSAGPIAFVGLAEYRNEAPGNFRHRPGGWGGAKVLAVVTAGRTVTVTVPDAEAGRLALLYSVTSFHDSGLYRPGDGERSVTFRACPPGQTAAGEGGTQFNGGFVVAGAQCATLDVTTDGGPARHVRFAFGRGACSSGA